MNANKIALIFEPGHLVVQHWRLAVSGWRIVQTERAVLDGKEPLGDQLIGALRPLSFKWRLPTATPVMVLNPPQVGGFFGFKFDRRAKEIPSLVEKELAKQLPFSLREVEWVHQTWSSKESVEATVFWMPKPWIAELRNALARAGLRLSELFHRAQLYADRHQQLRAAALPHAWIEAFGDELYWYFQRHASGPERARLLGQAQDPNLAAALQLDLLGLGLSDRTKLTIDLCNVPGPAMEAISRVGERNVMVFPQTGKPLDMTTALLDFWHHGGSGVWLAPDQASLGLRTAPVALLLFAAGLLFSASLWWLSSLAEEEITSQEPRLKKLKPAYQKALETEEQIVALQNQLSDIEKAGSGHPSPLNHLYQVYKLVPDDAWLTRFRSGKSGIEIEGYGVDAAELKKKIGESGKFGQFADITPLTATDASRKAFAFTMQVVVPGAKPTADALPAKPLPTAASAAPTAASVTAVSTRKGDK